MTNEMTKITIAPPHSEAKTIECTAYILVAMPQDDQHYSISYLSSGAADLTRLASIAFFQTMATAIKELILKESSEQGRKFARAMITMLLMENTSDPEELKQKQEQFMKMWEQARREG